MYIEEKEMILERELFYVRMQLEKHGLNKEMVELRKFEAFDKIVYELNYGIAKKTEIRPIKKTFNINSKHEFKIITEIPKSIWQMIKLKYAPRWFVRKFPVDYVEKTVKVNEPLNIMLETEVAIDVAFPNLVIPKESQYMHFRFLDAERFTIID